MVLLFVGLGFRVFVVESLLESAPTKDLAIELFRDSKLALRFALVFLFLGFRGLIAMLTTSSVVKGRFHPEISDTQRILRPIPRNTH